MNDRKNDNLSRKDFEEPQAVPVRHGALKRAALLLVTLVAVLGIVLAAAYWDLSNFDSVRRLFIYNKVEQDESGRAQLYNYDNDRSNLFAKLGSRLVVVSTTRVSILSDDGTEVFSQPVKLTNPGISCGGKTVAVYDIGGTEFYVFGEKGLVRDMSAVSENGLTSVKLNSSDYMAVVTDKSGYKSAVSIYNTAGELVFALNSSASYILDACCERDCKGVAVVVMGEKEGAFESTVVRYSFDSESPVSSCAMEDTLILTLESINQSLVALSDDRFAALAKDGSLAGAYLYSYPYLQDYTLSGTDFGAVVLSRYRSGSTSRVVTLRADGTMLASFETQKEVVDISACGHYLAVLYDDSFIIYTSELEEYATLSDTQYARAVLMNDDGTALLLGATEGWLFIP